MVTITDGTNTLWVSPRSGSLAASQVGFVRFYFGYGGAEGSTATTGLTTANANIANYGPLPDFILPAGYVIRIYDVAAIQPAADDLVVVLHYIEYDA